MPSPVLDLGAMAVLVGTVSLSLEKVSLNKDRVGEELKKLQGEIATRISTVDIPVSYEDTETGEKKINLIFDNCRFHFLLCIGHCLERKHYPRGSRFLYWFHRNVRAPFLGPMRKGWHTLIIGTLTAFSVLYFFLQIAAETFEEAKIDHWIPSDHCLFCIYGLTILMAFGSALNAHWLAQVRPRCERYLKKFDSEKKQEDKLAAERMERELKAFTKAPPAASGSTNPPG